MAGQVQERTDFEMAGVRPGDIIAGKFRIERILGIGGMGIVVAAHHLHLDERVAIKFLLPEALLNPEVVARFAREARAAVKIKSEHVARVTDVGTLESGSPYMVMEYLEGSDLSNWIRQRGALSIEQAVEFILQACEAIADAHGMGIVHRDLKPANLFCIRRSDGLLAIKVLDFGISKVTKPSGAEVEAQLTRTTSVFGSPLYMSPEQMLSSRDVDARTDIWAIGTILYELLTSRSPFDGETLPEIYARISSQPPPPLRDHRPDAPLELEAVILKCLEKDRANRYPNIAQFALALTPFANKRALASIDRVCRVIQAAGLSATALSLPPSSPLVGGGADLGTNAAWGNTAPESRRSFRTAKTVGVLVIAASVLGAIVILRPARNSTLAGVATNQLDGASSAVLGGTPSVDATIRVVPVAASVEPKIGGPTPTVVPTAELPQAQPARRARVQPLAKSPPVPSSELLPKAPLRPVAPAATPAPSTNSGRADWLHRQY